MKTERIYSITRFKLNKRKCSPIDQDDTQKKVVCINCNWVYLKDKKTGLEFFVEEFLPNSILTASTTSGDSLEVPIIAVDGYYILVKTPTPRCVNKKEFKSLKVFCLMEIFYINQIKDTAGKWISTCRIFLNSKRSLPSKPRMQILNHIVRKYALSSNRVFTSQQIMNEINPKNWAHYKDGMDKLRMMELYIETFVENGDAEKHNDFGYRLLPKSVITLEKYEIDAQKHSNSISLQRIALAFTSILSISSVAKIFIN